MEKYQKYDWGMVSQDDWKMNDEALEQGERLLASYSTCKGKMDYYGMGQKCDNYFVSR